MHQITPLFCSWQVISAVEVSGFVTSATDLITIQNKVYKKPTVLIATRVTGEEEIPNGVVGVLTPDMPDILSHVSIRARNNKACNFIAALLQFFLKKVFTTKIVYIIWNEKCSI